MSRNTNNPHKNVTSPEKRKVPLKAICLAHRSDNNFLIPDKSFGKFCF